MGYFLLRLEKENFKFSCSHFTIFDDHHAERLHGHNYQVRCELKLAQVRQDIGMAFDFNLVKPVIRRLCEELDERILLAEKSPYLKFQPEQQNLEVSFASKKYSFPSDDVHLLPIVNVTTEELSRYFAETLLDRLRGQAQFLELSLTVEETRGQSSTFTVQP